MRQSILLSLRLLPVRLHCHPEIAMDSRFAAYHVFARLVRESSRTLAGALLSPKPGPTVASTFRNTMSEHRISCCAIAKSVGSQSQTGAVLVKPPRRLA